MQTIISSTEGIDKVMHSLSLGLLVPSPLELQLNLQRECSPRCENIRTLRGGEKTSFCWRLFPYGSRFTTDRGIIVSKGIIIIAGNEFCVQFVTQKRSLGNEQYPSKWRYGYWIACLRRCQVRIVFVGLRLPTNLVASLEFDYEAFPQIDWDRLSAPTARWIFYFHVKFFIANIITLYINSYFYIYFLKSP